jgi:3-deoxy-7-phosphoheptulonate synthase
VHAADLAMNSKSVPAAAKTSSPTVAPEVAPEAAPSTWMVASFWSRKALQLSNYPNKEELDIASSVST